MQIFGTMEKGNLVPDEVVIDLLAEAMAKESKGFILDGFPATLDQAKLFEKTVGAPCKIILFDMSDELMRIRPVPSRRGSPLSMRKQNQWLLSILRL